MLSCCRHSSTSDVGMRVVRAQPFAGSGARLFPHLVGRETFSELLSLRASVSSCVQWSHRESQSRWFASHMASVGVGGDRSTVWAHSDPVYVLVAVLICRAKCRHPSSFPIFPARTPSLLRCKAQAVRCCCSSHLYNYRTDMKVEAVVADVY